MISDWAFETGVEGDPTKRPAASSCGTIKPSDIPLLQVLVVEFPGSAGVVTTKVIELAMSRRLFCCVEFPGEGTPKGPASEEVDMLALLIDANSFWVAVIRTMFTAGATTTLVTNASAMLTKSPVSVETDMM